MGDMPAQCTNCGASFLSAGISIGAATGLQMTGGTTTCPRCGGTARFIEGTMNIQDGGVELLSGPQWSYELLDELRLTLRRIIDDRPEDPIAEIQRVSPALAADVNRVAGTWGYERLMMLLMAILTAIPAGLEIEARISPPQVRPIVELLREAERTGEPPPVRSTGRNDPCPCGSGVKFKRCHGAPHQRR